MSIPKLGSIGALIRQAASGPYWELLASLVGNDSSVPGSNIRDALNTLFGQGGGNVQANWYVDPVGGNDNADGASALTALRTMGQLSDRIRTAYLRQTTTVHVLGDIPDDDPFLFSGVIGGLDTQLVIVGEAPTLLASGALTFVQNVVIGVTRPSIRVAGIADWTSLVGKRVRVTGGPTPVDTLFWIAAVDGGDTSLAYISTPLDGATVRNLTVASTVAVEELTKVGPLSVPWLIDGVLRTSNTVCTIQHVSIPFGIARFGSGQGSLVSGAETQKQAQTLIYGCEIKADNLQLDAGTIRACAIQGRNIHILQCGSGVSAQASLFRATARTQISAGALALQSQCMFQNGTFIVGTSRNETAYLRIETGLSFWQWPTNTAAVSCSAGGNVSIGALVWGTSTNATTYGWNISSGAIAPYTTKPTVAGTATPIKDVSLGGVDTAYAAIPAINASNNAAMVINA